MRATLQVARAVQRARRGGRSFQYAAARTALWLLNDFPAHLEAFMIPDALLAKVCPKAAKDTCD